MKVYIRNMLLILYATAISITTSLMPKVVIWDLGDTLMQPDKQYAMSRVGMWDCLHIYMEHGSCDIIHDTIYDVLRESEKNGPADKYCACDPHGQPMPQLMCDWFSGSKPSKELLDEALTRLKNYTKPLDIRLRRIVEKTLKMMLNPNSLARSMRPIHKAVHLLRKSAYAKDKYGHKRNVMVILSNWDAESFKLVSKRPVNQHIFKHFSHENIFISGNINDFKPHLSIFEYMLKMLRIKNKGLAAKDCIFIDDNEKNLKAAQEVGITTIHVKNNDYKYVEKRLRELGVF